MHFFSVHTILTGKWIILAAVGAWWFSCARSYPASTQDHLQPWPVRNWASQQEVSSEPFCHRSVEKLSSMKPVPGAKKVGDRWSAYLCSCLTGWIGRIYWMPPAATSQPWKTEILHLYRNNPLIYTRSSWKWKKMRPSNSSLSIVRFGSWSFQFPKSLNAEVYL